MKFCHFILSLLRGLLPIADYIKNITKSVMLLRLKSVCQDKENFLIVQLRHLQNKNFRKPETTNATEKSDNAFAKAHVCRIRC